MEYPSKDLSILDLNSEGQKERSVTFEKVISLKLPQETIVVKQGITCNCRMLQSKLLA